MLIMSYRETVDAITENFKAFISEYDGNEPGLLPLTNSRYEE